MITMKSKSIALFVLFFFALFPTIANAAAIHLSVAASMTDVIKELAVAYSKVHPEVSILPNFGSSGSQAKQINLGAPADLFVSANKKWMDYLVQEGKVEPKTVRIFASNSLVFIGAPKAGVSSLDEIASLPRIAIGSPQSVPAGQYAAQAMRAKGFYRNLLGKNILVMAKDVRQALLYADRGEVAGAFVYKTDALLAEHAVILFTVPAGLHAPIDYQVGLTLEGEKNEAAKSFYSYLATPAALVILKKFGFSAPSSSKGEPKKRHSRS